MKTILISTFVLFTAVICLPQNAAAQTATVSADGIYREEGIASYYGSAYNGRPTASGEIFDSSKLTAAHPTLPFGTLLLITNRHNNRKISVRVNDRGPFVKTRVIDVSQEAAAQLDMIQTGTAPVLIEEIPTRPATAIAPVPVQPAPIAAPAAMVQADAVPPPQLPPSAPPVRTTVQTQPEVSPAAPVATPPATATATVMVYPPVSLPQEQIAVPPIVSPPAPPAIPAPPAPAAVQAPPVLPNPAAVLIPALIPQPGKTYKLQIGSYKVANNAINTLVKLREAGLNPSYEKYETPDTAAGNSGGKIQYYRVVLAGLKGNDIQAAAEKIRLAGFAEAVIREQ